MDGHSQAMARPVRAAVAIWVLLGLVMIVVGGGRLTGSPDWGQGLIFAAPVIALITVVVTAAVLLVAAVLGSLDMELGDVWGVVIISVPLAPIAAIVLAFAAGGALLAVPLFVEGFGVGFLLWLGLWWPITIGVGLPLVLVRLFRLLGARGSQQDLFASAGPAGSDAATVPAGTAVGGTSASGADTDPRLLRLLGGVVSVALGPPGGRRPLAIRIPLGVAAAVVLVPVIWAWGLGSLVSRRYDLGNRRSVRWTNSLLQLLALVPAITRELVLGVRATSAPGSATPTVDEADAHDAAERTLAMYRRELGIDDPAALILLALSAAYSIAAAISAIAGLFLGVEAAVFGSALAGAHPLVVPVAFGLLAPLASFAVFIAVVLVADRFGHRPGDYSLSAVAVVVPIGLAILLVRLAG